MKPTTWIEINRSHLEHNLAQYQIWLGNKTGIAPVIKANAYGHGLCEIASICDNSEFVQRLCVVNTQEALQLRKYGIKKSILVIGYTNSDLQEVVLNNIDISVYDMHTINQLQNTAARLQKTINVHLKVDTGLSRLGIFPKEVQTYITYIHNLSNLHLQGIWSHLSSGNDTEIVHEQEKIFAAVKQNNLQTHISNSHGSMQIQNNYSFARIGSGIYGYLLTGNKQQQSVLKPVLSLKSTIIYIKTLPVGTHVGYQQGFTTTTPTTIAILGIGYYDGINSKLIHGGKVIIHGQYAPILSINMNMTTVDISHIPQCKIQDTVILLGEEDNKKISGYSWQKVLNLNLRESLTKLESSIPRIIIDDTSHNHTHKNNVKTNTLNL